MFAILPLSRTSGSLPISVLLVWLLCAGTVHAADPLASWKDTDTKAAIVDFVQTISDQDSNGFVPEPERIAVFDNDGTLWAEQPMYFQAFFVFDEIRRQASQHPEWQNTEPFASVLKGDIESALSGGAEALLNLAMTASAGMTTSEYDASVLDWLAQAKHPDTGRRYTEMVYQPMLELLEYLQAAGFKTFIVSGGGIDFMRPWTEDTYNIPPEQVVGSSVIKEFEIRNGEPVIIRKAEIDFIDDKAGKPVGIHQHIGRRPIAAFGNSDGDLQMLQWTMAGEGRRFAALIHHTDAEREWAYDRESHIGKLDQALDEAQTNGWTVVDMQRDWETIYPPQ